MLLFLATLFGALFGFERENSSAEKNYDSTSGIRTFALTSLLGGIAGVLFVQQITALLVVLSAAVALLIIAYYVLTSLLNRQPGITTEISLLFAFFVGFLTVTEVVPIQVILATVVVVLLILSLKGKTQKLIAGISAREIESFITYAIVALVILPFLPNLPITLSSVPGMAEFLQGFSINLGQFGTMEILNPRKLWMVVVLITGIDVVGYILARLVGNKKSLALTSFVGGFISSTSTTQALAQRSKRATLVNGLVGAALFANLASFFQIFLLIGPLNQKLIVELAPLIFIIIVAAAALGIFFLGRREKGVPDSKQVAEDAAPDRQIFSLTSALKFAVLITVIKIVTKICLILFGQAGFLVSSVVASLAGLDAILINLAEITGKTITFETAALTFVLVNATNLISKTVYSFIQGSRKFSLHLAIAMGLILVSSVVGYIVFV